MNHIYWLLVLVMAAPRLMAVDTGLYDISDASHPKPFRDQIERATISSQSNDNKHYFLALHAADSFSLPCSQIGLIVGTKTIRFNSQGMDNKGRFTSMETHVDDPEVIPQIAQYFHANVQKRRHPGHRMLVEFITDKAEFAAGESITVRLRISNIGEAEFAFIQGGRQRGSRDNQFAFSTVGSKIVSDTGDPLNFGGIGIPVTLKAGESHDIAVDFAKWFNFKEGGTYNLRGSYQMEFINPNAQDLYRIWEDYA